MREPDITGLDATEISNEAFKELFPEQYASYARTAEMDDDPDGNRSKFKREPFLPILYYDFTFARQHDETRGHFYANEDLAKSLRVTDSTPGACITCKSSAVPVLYAEMGEDYWQANLLDEIIPAAEELGHAAVGCSDCHSPVTMDIRVTRPNLQKEMADKGIDPNKASRENMNNYACGQCHSTYYFNVETTEVTHPWSHMNLPEQTEKLSGIFDPDQARPGDVALKLFVYFQTVGKERGFEQDFIHAVSGTPILKARHPEFEMSTEGAHAEAGVSCVDCHMPVEKGKSGDQITSHYLTSPLKDPEKSCGSCHTSNLDQKVKQTEKIQADYKQKLAKAQEISVDTHYYVNKMITAGVDTEVIKDLQREITFAQWMWDFCASENSHGFHNPAGADRILDLSIQSSQEILKVAKEHLIAKDVSIEELDKEIAKVKKAVSEESDPAKKRDHVINDYFPAQD